MKKQFLTLKRALLFIVAATLSLSAFAQNNVSGTVIDNNGEPVIGASVVVKGTSTGTVTDLDGKYSLVNVARNAVLEFSSIGFETVEENVNGRPVINVILNESSEFLDDVVVTGYMTEKKADLTGSVSVVNMKEVSEIPTTNVFSNLQGRVAGMNVSVDGTPGAKGTSARIRGTTSINSATPLYVVDGVIVDSGVNSLVSSYDIESIQVLKDAASAAIYGAQAAAGVIIITTKKAKAGEIRVDFNTTLTAQTYSENLDLMDSYQWGDVYWQAYKYAYGVTPKTQIFGSGPTPVLSTDYYYAVDGVHLKPANTDWQKEIYGTAFMRDYNLTLSKGTENQNSSVSLNYVNQDGMLKETGYTAFNIRANNEFRFLKNKLILGQSVTVHRDIAYNGSTSTINEYLNRIMPMVPVYSEEGGWGGGMVDILNDTWNVVRMCDFIKYSPTTVWRAFGNVYAEVRPVKGLSIKSTYSMNWSSTDSKSFTPKYQESTRIIATNSLSESHNTSLQWVWSNTATYTNTFGKHNLTAMLGMEAKDRSTTSMSASGNDLALEDMSYQVLNTVTTSKNVSGTKGEYTMLSFFGKLNYNYDERYLASFTLRRDSSSRFGSNTNTGYFPSASFGWRITQEKFMAGTRNWLNSLKLRVSWGMNGNDAIPDGRTYNIYQLSLDAASYNLSGDGKTLATGARRTSKGNNNLKWESTTQTNFGLDASLFKNRLDITADYFNKDTKDMLWNATVAGVQGEGASSYINAASMNNKGVELLVSWHDDINRDWNYGITFNMSIYRNKITSIPEEQYYTYGCGNGKDLSNVGLPINSWLGYKTDGYFRTQAEVDDYLATYDDKLGRADIGRIRFVDTNNDKVIDASDRVWLGHSNPMMEGGLNLQLSYKQFDLTMFFNGMVKQSNNANKYMTDLFQCWNGNHSTRLVQALNDWKEYEKTGVYNSKYPALTVEDTNKENSQTRLSDWYIEDGSFIRLKTLSLGYTLPRNFLNKIGLRNGRVFLQGTNLLTFTKFTGADPEQAANAYPVARNITLGISIGL